MKRYQLNLTILLISLISFSANAQLNINLETFASGFTRPVDIQSTGTDSRLFIIEQAGKIWIIDSLGNRNASPFLDISSQVNSNGNEQGLLGIAFHPDFINNPYFFVHYTTSNDSTRISLFALSNDPDSADPNSEFIILTEAQPFTNHNGGSIAFGPDGYLYIALGDGGSAGDPGDRAQDLTTVLGKIFRININTALAYGIPQDNPFVGAGAGVREEIWAYGLRNPWKMSFDRLTGDLWIGDVGQNALEEIDFQPASSIGGENYGWRCYEGTSTFNTTDCPHDSTMTDPVYEYSHSSGGCSVTGGVVYRGSRYPGLYGRYFFSDICTGWIRSLDSVYIMTDHGTFSSSNYFVAFGENSEGEVFVSGLNDGKISRIVEEPTDLDALTENKFEIFPNPVNGLLTIRFKRGTSFTYELQDLRGSMLITGLKNGSEANINMENLQPGVYLLKLNFENSRSVKKILVE